MDAVELAKLAVSSSHEWFQGTVADLTQEQANHVPSGVAHPIIATVAHVLHGEDGIVNMMLAGKPTVWEQGGWAARSGTPFVMMQDSATARSFTCDLGLLREYSKAVYASTDAYLGSLTPADLDRTVDMSAAGMGSQSVGFLLTMILVGNNFAHTGEISSQKGLLGNKGYPF